MIECEHGSLARSCERCDDKREIYELRAQLSSEHKCECCMVLPGIKKQLAEKESEITQIAVAVKAIRMITDFTWPVDIISVPVLPVDEAADKRIDELMARQKK